MLQRPPFFAIALAVVVSMGVAPTEAQAGPLLDWLFGHHRQQAPAYAVGYPMAVGGYQAGYCGAPTGYAGNYGTYYHGQLPVIGPAGAGYPAPQASGITAATAPSTVTLVPDYRSSSYRAPVTYYRPVLTTDPTSGAQVVAMAPCSSYEYQTQRVPTWGRRSLFGGFAPNASAPPAQAFPTYTLPSGGVPLASGAPAISAPYSTSYGTYSALQPSVTGVPPATNYGSAGSYPSAPVGAAPYAGINGGSSGGNPYAPVPGLIAPQSPASTAPGYPATPSYPSAPNYPGAPAQSYPSPGSNINPGYPSPGASQGIYPPSGDPADSIPTLGGYPTTSNSSNQLKPQLRSIVRQPQQSGSAANFESPNRVDNRADSESDLMPLPRLSPIPAPEGFERDRKWNPGLLREDDMTAMKRIAPGAIELAGQSKPIHWASFESSPAPAAGEVSRGSTLSNSQPLRTIQSESRLRPILPSSTHDSSAQRQKPEASLSFDAPNDATPQQSPRRSTGGWQTSR